MQTSFHTSFYWVLCFFIGPYFASPCFVRAKYHAGLMWIGKNCTSSQKSLTPGELD